MTKWRTFIDPSVGDGQNTIDGIIADGSAFGVGISDDLSVTGLSTFSDVARFSSTVRLDGQLRDGDNAFGSSGQVLSSDGTDTRWVNAGSLSAGAASLVAINDDGNTDAFRFITFVDSSSGNNALKTDSVIKYNPSTNILNLNATESGIKFGAGDALNDDAHIEWLGGNNAGYLRISTSDDNGTEYIQFGDYDNQNRGGTFTQWLRISRDTGTFTGTFSATTFSGSGASLTSLNASNISSGTINAARVPTLNQNTTGSAATLTTARTIGGVSFNGSANINLPGVNQSGNQNTSGNAATATVLETTRNFSISGEITANAQSFNGSGNVALSATVDDNVIDEANLKISNSPQNGFFLKCNTGVSGGLTWSEVSLPTAATLDGTTLASGITASSITSLGTLTGLTVSGNASFGSGSFSISSNVSITGTVNIDNTITLDSKNEDPSHDKGVIIIQPSTSGGRTGINFRSKENPTSDHGYLWWYDDNNNYRTGGDSAENAAFVIGVQNDASSATPGDAIAMESSGDIFLNPGTSNNSRGGASGPDFARGKVYIGRAATKYQVWHEGNDGSGSGLDSDKLDGQEGSYYRNAGNLNDGTIPDARISGNFLKSNASDTMTGNLSLYGNLLLTGDATTTNQARTIDFTGFDKETTNDFTDRAYIQHTTNTGGLAGSVLVISSRNDTTDGINFDTNGNTNVKHNGNTVWNAGNDGSGSGLDADLLDGQQGSHYLNYNNLSNRPTIPTNNNQLTNGRGFITSTDVRSMNEAASTGQSNTTSSVFQDKVTLSINTVSNSRVLVLFGFEIKHSNNNNQSTTARVTGDNISFVGGNYQKSHSNQTWTEFQGQRLDISSHTGTRTYRIQWNRNQNTGSIRNAYLVVIEMSV